MAINAFNGWLITSILSWVTGKNESSDTSVEQKPEELSIQETKTGTPVPVVVGRTLLKSPLVTYFGGFRYEPYTETYAAHSNFSAWPIILQALLGWLLKPITGESVTQHTHKWRGGNSGGPVSGVTDPENPSPIKNKEKEGPNYLMMLALWLLEWLINGRNLKTTMQKGFKYFLGYQMIFCHSGKNMRIRSIWMGQTKVWEGDASRETHPNGFIIPINNENLFGGADENGGFVGELRVYLGGPNQPADPWMVQQMSADSVQPELRGKTPAYRPFVTLVVPTAYVGKRATIPETWIEVQYTPDALGLGAVGEDSNPAETLYEILTNKTWGMGELPKVIDIDSLKALGAKTKEEKVGITTVFSSRVQARNVFDNIMDHIDATRSVYPATGKLTFKLIRDDYDAAKVLVLDETNCESVHFSRLTWQQTVGEIIATYSDRKANYEESSLTVNDPGNIAINNGTKNTKQIDMTYFTTAENALWAAEREGRAAGYPLATISVVGNRNLCNIRSGEVVKLNWPPYGIENLLMRVTDVNIGNFIDGKVEIEAVEDVFGLDKTTFGFNSGDEWKPPVIYPTGAQVFRYFEMPWEMGRAKDSYVEAFCARPDDTTIKWTVWRKRPADDFHTTTSMLKWTHVGRLVNNIAEDSAVEDSVGFEIVDIGGELSELMKKVQAAGTDIDSARRGSKILVVGDELIAFSNIEQLPNGHWRVFGILRGVHDTVPAKHSNGEYVYFIDSGTYANVTTGGAVCPVGSTVTEQYNITTATATKEEEFDNAKITSFSTVRRPERPSPPGRIRVHDNNGQILRYTDSVVGGVEISWKYRDKTFTFGAVSQDDEFDYFTGQLYKAPDNSRYVFRVYVGGVRVGEYTTSEEFYLYKWEDRVQDSNNFKDKTVVEILCRQNGLESYQAHRREFSWRIPTVIGHAETVEQAKSLAASMGAETRVTIPASGWISGDKFVEYADMPVVVSGMECPEGTPGSVPCPDEKAVYPDGKLYIVKGKGEVEEYRMDAGFMFRNYSNPFGGGGVQYHSYDGIDFKPFTGGIL